jgi:integrase
MKANNFGHNSQYKTIDDFIVNGRVKITKEIIEKYFKLNVGKDGQYIDSVLNDSECIGLRLRKRSNRNLTWYFERWNKKLNKPSKYKLLNYPELSIKAARTLATELRSKIVLGEDPKTIIAEYTDAKSLRVFADEWVKNVLNVSKRFRPGTRKQTRARLKTWLYLKPSLKIGTNKKTREIINKHFSVLNIQNKKLRDITHEDAIAFHDAITNCSPSQANRVIDDVQQIFKWAIAKEEIKENPFLFSAKERNTIDKRMDRTKPFTKPQWKTITKVATQLAYKNTRVATACYALLMLANTGRRKMEIQRMQWKANVREMQQELYFPSEEQKNDNTLTVPLLPGAMAVLKRLKAIRKQNSKTLTTTKRAYCFPATRRSKKPYIVKTDKTWKQIIKLAQKKDATIEYKCIHMLRHTFACLLLEATNDIQYVADLMGWKSLKVAQVYTAYLGQQTKKAGIKKLHNFLHVA